MKEVQKKVQTKLPEVYLRKCVEWIKTEANNNLMATAIGSNVKMLIQSQWREELVGNTIKLSNTAEYEKGVNLAVFVEFGVGIVGQQSPHEKAQEANYQYNVPSNAKRNDGQWSFSADDGESYMNLEKGYYNTFNLGDGALTVVSKGSPATLFLYKAVTAFQTSGAYKTLWEQAKAEVIG